jgi:restriction endonuclease Mrr
LRLPSPAGQQQSGDDLQSQTSECQKLIGAMVGSQVKRGLILTNGAFDPSCNDYATNLQGMRLELIGGSELVATHRALTTPPLAKWFGAAA